MKICDNIEPLKMLEGQTKLRGYYPVLISIEGKICVVVGGGRVAERKIGRLLECGAIVEVIAGHLTPVLEEKRQNGVIQLISRDYRDSLIDHADLVFAATDNPELNRRIARYASRKGILCNCVTDPRESSFLVPALFRRGALNIAISTSGMSPAAARRIRLQLEKLFDKEWEGYLDLLGALREVIHAKGFNARENQKVFNKLVELPLLEWIRQGRGNEAVEGILEVCKPLLSREEISRIWEQTWKTSS